MLTSFTLIMTATVSPPSNACISVTPFRTWGYIMDATNDWKTNAWGKIGSALTAAEKFWQGKYKGLKCPPLRWGQDGVSARLLTVDDLRAWGLTMRSLSVWSTTCISSITFERARRRIIEA